MGRSGCKGTWGSGALSTACVNSTHVRRSWRPHTHIYLQFHTIPRSGPRWLITTHRDGTKWRHWFCQLQKHISRICWQQKRNVRHCAMLHLASLPPIPWIPDLTAGHKHSWCLFAVRTPWTTLSCCTTAGQSSWTPTLGLERLREQVKTPSSPTPPVLILNNISFLSHKVSHLQLLYGYTMLQQYFLHCFLIKVK